MCASRLIVSGLLALTWLLATACGDDRSDEAVSQIGSRVESAPHPLGNHVSNSYKGGLERVLRDRYLRVLTSDNSFDYYIHEGIPGGYQYEMVQAFVGALNEKYPPKEGKPAIQVELLPVSSDQLFSALRDGRGDLIAARLTVNERDSERVRFSVPYERVDHTVLTSLDPADFRKPDDFAGKRLAVAKGSTYHESVIALNRSLAGRGLESIEIVFVPDGLETESIVALVADGEYEFTLVGSTFAMLASEVFPGIHRTEVPLRTGVELAWATDPANAKLLAEIDAFLPRYAAGSLLGNMAIRKYFRNPDRIRSRLEADGSAALSSYDSLFRKYSALHGFDWRLVAAVAYQESRFRQSAVNPSGATGLFQIKPETAREEYIGIPEIAGEHNAEKNVEAGIKYLAWIRSRYFEPIDEMTERDRIRMTLAAYNAGPASLIAARRRAQEMGLDPDRWFRNVELALLDSAKPEPVAYVSEVNKRYVSYVLLGVDR